MGHLGDFGAAVKELDPNAPRDTFGFFGEKFEILDELPPMLIFQLAAGMTGKVDETEAMGAMWAALNVALDEPDLDPWTGDGEDPRPAPKKQFTTFYKLAVAKRADIQSLMELVMTLFQASGGERPTASAPDSVVGPSTTSPSSNTSSSAPQVFGGDQRDLSVPHLRPLSEVLAG